ncbi:MFS transporter [Streptomyces sp. LX-29]|uniref:MFS transporter n=1 Tax=Streptomyces sp. LX-29 TaxID=2900152 RepID=UPI00240D77FC|nr:MFS transporter [Streptomyces sp. LX-29]WFB06056.1 MFS transporter [Streptomyces sp. LX-29]
MPAAEHGGWSTTHTSREAGVAPEPVMAAAAGGKGESGDSTALSTVGEDGSVAATPPRPASGRDVRLYWWANTSDALGTQISGLVLPVFLLSLGQSPAAIGLITGASLGAGLLLAPYAAVLADRGARKRVMVWSATVSAMAMGSVAAAAALGHVVWAHVLTALVVERFATSCQEAAASGTVAAVAPRADYPRVVSRLQAGEQGAVVAGPVLGGWLYQWFRWLPFLADAVSYLVAAVCVRRMRSDLTPAPAPAPDPTAPVPGPSPVPVPDPSPAPSPGVGTEASAGPPRTAWRATATEVGAGVRLALDTPFLRLVLLWTTAVGGALGGLYYSVVFRVGGDGTHASALGLALSCAGGAGLVGSLAAPRLARRLSPAAGLVAVSWLMVPIAAGLALTDRLWAYGVLFGALSLLTAVVTVVLQAHAVAVTPPHLQARTGAALATAAGAAAALAPIMAGACADGFGPAATSAGCAVLLAAVAAWTTRAALAGSLPGRSA